jgi:hypothetical protein
VFACIFREKAHFAPLHVLISREIQQPAILHVGQTLVPPMFGDLDVRISREICKLQIRMCVFPEK